VIREGQVKKPGGMIHDPPFMSDRFKSFFGKEQALAQGTSLSGAT
jgi:hypothetical protein